MFFSPMEQFDLVPIFIKQISFINVIYFYISFFFNYDLFGQHDIWFHWKDYILFHISFINELSDSVGELTKKFGIITKGIFFKLMYHTTDYTPEFHRVFDLFCYKMTYGNIFYFGAKIVNFSFVFITNYIIYLFLTISFLSIVFFFNNKIKYYLFLVYIYLY